jgi:serine/threonine-protein kinase
MKYCTLCKARYDDGVSFCSVDGEVLEDDPSSIVDTILDGQYHIEALLGKGGMGAVFRARHILLGDRVAIKVLPPEMRTNAEWLRRFRREGQAARRFRHPNAVTVYDLRTASDGMIYMVMEYVEGHTLDAELKARGHFTPGEAVAVLEPIMSVLNAAHAMGVVHRDLKPENIMIGKAATGNEPNVKLLDLGIAKLREVAGGDGGKNTALTVAGQMLGTPYYMSPEQWGELPLDGISEIDGRADIYSLGLVFYEMIAGRRPYSAMTLLELRKEHVSVVPRKLDEVMPGVPHGFSDVIARAMAKDRSDRPSTTGELAEELKAALAASENGSAHFVSAVRDAVPGASPLETVAIEQGRDTKSDVNAPTIITLDAVAPQAEVSKPPESLTSSQTAASTMPTLIESAEAVPRVTTPQVRPEESKPEPVSVGPIPAPVPAPSRGSKAPLIVGGVLILILLVGGVGGFLIWNYMKSSPVDPGTNNTNGTSTSEAKQLGRYWLEVSSSQDAKSAQVVPSVPIASGQYFKFHFLPMEDGYLYIFGPGDKNKLSAFLTASSDPEETGWSTNQVKKGVDVSLPTGSRGKEERWAQLDTKPGAESYIMVFSPTAISSPSFFSSVRTSPELSASEEQEFLSFVEKYKKDAKIDYDYSNPAAPFVQVMAPNSKAAGNPLVIEIRIEHK